MPGPIRQITAPGFPSVRDGVGVVAEVHSVAGADFDVAAGESGQCVVSVFGVPRCSDSALVLSYMRAKRGCWNWERSGVGSALLRQAWYPRMVAMPVSAW